jgi:hypothetical protein
VAVNGGDAHTRSLAATLAISATDASGVASMCVSNSTTCTAWEPYATTRAWNLAAGGTGTRTVHVRFRDVYGNASAAPVADAVVYDVTAPGGGALTATAGAGQVALSWSGFSDPHSGVGSYVVVSAVGTAPASCSAGTRIYAGASTAFVHSGLVSGTTYGYRLCAVDRLGNTSAGLTRTARVP